MMNTHAIRRSGMLILPCLVVILTLGLIIASLGTGGTVRARSALAGTSVRRVLEQAADLAFASASTQIEEAAGTPEVPPRGGQRDLGQKLNWPREVQPLDAKPALSSLNINATAVGIVVGPWRQERDGGAKFGYYWRESGLVALWVAVRQGRTTLSVRVIRRCYTVLDGGRCRVRIATSDLVREEVRS
jgi:hypothetical protein